MKKSVIAAVAALVIIAGAGYALVSSRSSDDKPKPAPASARSSTAKSSGEDSVPAVNNAVLTTKTDAKIGRYLADPSGRALYVYDVDTKGVSNCTASCLAAWPAYVDTGATTGLPSGVGTIKRSDNGQIQYTYDGLPLYYFAHDAQGQVSGDGVDMFSVAKPVAGATANSDSSGSSSDTGAPASGSVYDN